MAENAAHPRTVPSAETRANAVRDLVKVYLGPSCVYNLRRTRDERLQTRLDPACPEREWYRISGLAKFKRVLDVCSDLKFIAQSLASSADFEVDPSREWTRLRLAPKSSRVLVLGFPSCVSKQDVRSVFADYGVIEQLEVRPMSNGMNAVARIRFSTPEIAKRVLSEKKFAFGACELNAIPAPEKPVPKMPPKQDMACSVRAFGFESGTSADAVKKYFRMFAVVKSVSISDEKLFYALVEFDQASTAKRVASLVHTFDGVPLSVSLCVRNSEPSLPESQPSATGQSSLPAGKRSHQAVSLSCPTRQPNSVIHFGGVDPVESTYDSLMRAFSEVCPVVSVDYRRDETSGYVMLREPRAKECAEELTRRHFKIGVHQVKLRAIVGHEESTFWSCFDLRQAKRHRPNAAANDLQQTSSRVGPARWMTSSDDTVSAPSELQSIYVPKTPQAISVPSQRQGISASPKQQAISESPKQQTVSAPPKPQTISAPLKPQILSVPPKTQAMPAPPQPHPISVPPKPHPISAPPKPQAVSAPPGPQAVSAPPRPQAVSAPPRPQAVSAPPRPQAVSAPPRPQDGSAPPRSQVGSAPPRPQAAPPMAQALSGPPKQQARSAPLQPKSISIPPKPQTISARPKQQAVSAPSNPQAVSAPSNPQAVSVPPKPQAISVATKPQAVSVSPKPQTISALPNPQTFSAPPKSQVISASSKPQAISATLKPPAISAPSKLQARLPKPQAASVSSKPQEQRVELAVPISAPVAGKPRPANLFDAYPANKKSQRNTTQNARSGELRMPGTGEANVRSSTMNQPTIRNDTAGKQILPFPPVVTFQVPASTESGKNTPDTLGFTTASNGSLPAGGIPIPSGVAKNLRAYETVAPAERISEDMDHVMGTRGSGAAGGDDVGSKPQKRAEDAFETLHSLDIAAAATSTASVELGVLPNPTNVPTSAHPPKPPKPPRQPKPPKLPKPPKVPTAGNLKMRTAESIADASGKERKLQQKRPKSEAGPDAKQPKAAKQKAPRKSRGKLTDSDARLASTGDTKDSAETGPHAATATRKDPDPDMDLGELLDLLNKDLETALSEPAGTAFSSPESVSHSLPFSLQAPADNDDGNLSELVNLFNRELEAGFGTVNTAPVPLPGDSLLAAPTPATVKFAQQQTGFADVHQSTDYHSTADIPHQLSSTPFAGDFQDFVESSYCGLPSVGDSGFVQAFSSCQTTDRSSGLKAGGPSAAEEDNVTELLDWFSREIGSGVMIS